MSIPSLARTDIEAAAAWPKRQVAAALPRSLSIILLLGRQEAALETVVDALLRELTTWADDLEVIAVEQGRDERGDSPGERLLLEEPRLVLLRPATASYGAALAAGLSKASKEFICVMQGDPVLQVETLKQSFALLADYDAVLGFRQARGWQRLSSALWRPLLRFALGISLRDLHSPFKLYRAACFRHQALEMRSHLIDAEIIYKLVRAGYSYVEVPVAAAVPRSPGHSLRRIAHYWEGLCELGRCSARWYREEQGLL
jgi:dolichol-phosphate mannosyltransferase